MTRPCPLLAPRQISRICRYNRLLRHLPTISRRSLYLSISSNLRPTLAEISPPPHHLQIDKVKEIPNVLHKLRIHPNWAKQITKVVIFEAEAEDDDAKIESASSSDREALHQDSTEAAGEVTIKGNLGVQEGKNDRAGTLVAELLDQVRNNSGFDTFQWAGPDLNWSGLKKKGKRPAVFWKALWNSAENLRTLNFQFFDSELEELHEAHDRVPICPKFPKLEWAFLDASRAHGNNASFLDRWLRNCPALQTLELHLPNCDWETCQIQGITWDYDLPALETFSLYGYSLNIEGLAKFLHRSSALKLLTLELSTEKPFNLPSGSLPNLEALSMDFNGVPNLVSSLAPGFTTTPLRHLRVNGCPYESLLELAALPGSLRCLELELSPPWWEKTSTIADLETDDAPADANSATPFKLPKIIKMLLQRLPKLQELGLNLETADTTILEGSGDERTERHPDAISDDDLKLVLRLLDPNSSIRALRMSDSRGTPLRAEVLEDFARVPSSLEYVKWESRTGSVLYRLEREGERVRAVECEPLRQVEGNGHWTEKRVLDFEDSA